MTLVPALLTATGGEGAGVQIIPSASMLPDDRLVVGTALLCLSSWDWLICVPLGTKVSSAVLSRQGSGPALWNAAAGEE